MSDFTKLASFLDSFEKNSPGYDTACFIKKKLAEDVTDPLTFNNAEDNDLQDTDLTASSPEQQASKNEEGDMMGSAFPEFEALNQIDKQKEEIHVDGKQTANKNLQNNPDESFGDALPQQSQKTLFQHLQEKLRK